MDKLLPEAVDELTRYADRHLRREELLLRVRGYPRLAEHRAEHDEYRARVASLRAQLHRRDIGVRATNFLNAWWKEHILKSDMDYARYFQRLLK
jgi:hemerythrin-like metal-binding protein